METKEINVSEINNAGAAVVESKAEVVEVTPTVDAAAAQAAMVSAAVASALEGLGITKKEDPFAAAVKAEVAAGEIPVHERPAAELIHGRMGRISIYIPYDIRYDMNSWSSVINNGYLDTRTNEFKYINEPAQYLHAKRSVSVSGLDFYRSKDRIDEYLVDLEAYSDTTAEEQQRFRNELTRLVEEVDAFYAKTLGNISGLSETDEFTYEELGVLLAQANIPLAVENEGVLLGLTTISATPRMSMFGPYLECTGKMFTRNGSDITEYKHVYYFGGYGDKKSLKDLGIIPLATNPEVKETLISRGKRAVAITEKSSYMAYKGDILRRGYWSNTAFRATGRVMVDFTAMRTMDPNYSKYFGGFNDRDGYGYKAKSSAVTLDDNVYLSFSPYVYGFSFLSKVWGELKVDDISEISFRSDAYDKLVMEEEQKSMILSLVATQLQKTTRPDIIDGKGGGCIFLLAGEPGTGKTLTAEVTAEYLKRPLYMVGVGELGTTADELEGNLRQILDVAATWNAVLLLDECDIFMEARTDSNIQRNAMVGVFLRLLEYYQGVLFLTSNRAKNIDKAFYSRISMAINFPGLEAEDRFKIWTNNLALNDVKLDDGAIWELAEFEVNGRQIKNVCRNAHALAQHDGREAGYDDFILVLEKGEEFQEAVYQQGTSNTEMSFNAIAAKHEEVEDVVYGYRDDSFWGRLGRGIKAFFA